MGGDIGKVSRAEAVRILQEMNRLREKLSYRSIPAIMRQEFEQDIETWKMVLSEMNSYPVSLIRNDMAPWGLYVFAPEQSSAEIFPQTEPEMATVSSNTPPLSEYNYEQEVEHFIEVLKTMDQKKAYQAIQSVLEAIHHRNGA